MDKVIVSLVGVIAGLLGMALWGLGKGGDKTNDKANDKDLARMRANAKGTRQKTAEVRGNRKSKDDLGLKSPEPKRSSLSRREDL